ncbi:discoidin domain-containing protein [Thalassomonas sp. RHCl1]|uniref:discoidin domain-containing protein n=1 Tax=Thalassomonas sp. RHCl1 TaxID=2995320 RepID=UPI00248B8240|nr:discoidin domain-containing protein [Thalassomonas sp. RHCl1]
MKISALLPLLLVGVSLATSVNARAGSGVYAGGPLYQHPEYAVDELKSSGFTHVIAWTIHIESDGSLGFNGEFPLVSNGVYIGDNTYPNFRNEIASLKTGQTSISRVEMGLSGAGSGTYDNVRDLLSCNQSHCGTGPSSILYRNFLALKTAFPSVDALNNDDEGTYDLSSAAEFHIMLADLGFKTAIVPYTYKSFWQSFVSQVNQAHPGAVDLLYMQGYAGGAFNNPCSWDLGLPVYAGLWSRDDSPAEVQSQMQSWQDSCPDIIRGGFMWLYDDFDNSTQVAAYAAAINHVFDGNSGNPGGIEISARASIHSAENQDKAFDGELSTKWLDNAGTPTSAAPSWIQIRYPQAKVISSLTLTSANDESGRDPQDVTLLASDDGQNWTALGSWTGLSFSTRFDSKTLTFTNNRPFSHFKLNISKNKGDISMTQIAEITLTETGGQQGDIIDHSAASGAVLSARARIHSGEDESKAFDDDINSKWLDNAGAPSRRSPSWIQLDLPTAQTVNSITITSANDAAARDPQDFTVLGSNDNGASWHQLGSWTNILWLSRFEQQNFEFTNTTRYQTYRVNITKNQGNSSMTQVAEIELLGPLF